MKVKNTQRGVFLGAQGRKRDNVLDRSSLGLGKDSNQEK